MSKGVVLWENASPTSGFAAQYVDLAEEWVDCNKFDFYFNTDLEAGRGNAVFTLYRNDDDNYAYGYASFVYLVSSTWKIYTRFFDLNYGEELQNYGRAYFGVGYCNASEDSVTMVPLKIIGYKG